MEGPPTRARGTGAPPVVFLPAAERAGQVVAASSVAAPVIDMFKRVFEKSGYDAAADSTTSPALGLVEALERCCVTSVSGMVLLIEEPELYLRPQAQRYLYGHGGGSRHSPSTTYRNRSFGRWNDPSPWPKEVRGKD